MAMRPRAALSRPQRELHQSSQPEVSLVAVCCCALLLRGRQLSMLEAWLVVARAGYRVIQEPIQTTNEIQVLRELATPMVRSRAIRLPGSEAVQEWYRSRATAPIRLVNRG